MVKSNNEYIRKAKRKKKIKKIIISSILVAALVVVVINYTDIFKIKTIKCVGDNLVTGGYVVDKAEMLKNRNLLFISKSDFMKELKENPYVEDIKFSKKYPSTLEIRIVEKKGLYYASENGNYNIISDEMIYLEKVNSIDGRNLVEIKGANFSGKNLGDKVWDSERVKEILQDTYKVQKSFDDNRDNVKITSIDISNLSKIKLNFGEIEVYLGNDENLTNKIKTAAAIFKQGIAKKYINISFNGSPDIE
ncbi:FtsQ-type POTRA domain-containing protein [Clostridium sp. HBUAS56017]|uniref:cell division protein FtsQ/DivIB n=1 Tax=Clostridium sp. HBUAS56017 TaxID=2571128 RepID=UPI00163DD3AB|nr:FtsQ-type POTRA domain-containing protein [Clostridium sp. HBUAS56017]